MAKEVKQSQTRDKMYKYVGSLLGRSLTPTEHDEFRQIIKDYFSSTEEFVRYQEALRAKPLEHKLICGNCKRVEAAIGYKDKQKKRRAFICP